MNVVLEELSGEAEVHLLSSERASFVKEISRLSEQSLIGSSGRGFKPKALFLSLAMPTMCFVRQASSGSETTRQAGGAIKTPWSFRATSVERERNDGGVHSKHLLCQFSLSRET